MNAGWYGVWAGRSLLAAWFERIELNISLDSVVRMNVAAEDGLTEFGFAASRHIGAKSMSVYWVQVNSPISTQQANSASFSKLIHITLRNPPFKPIERVLTSFIYTQILIQLYLLPSLRISRIMMRHPQISPGELITRNFIPRLIRPLTFLIHLFSHIARPLILKIKPAFFFDICNRNLTLISSTSNQHIWLLPQQIHVPIAGPVNGIMSQRSMCQYLSFLLSSNDAFQLLIIWLHTCS